MKKKELPNIKFRRSLYFISDLKEGSVINESDVFIQMNTNGGMRDTDFWWDLGLLGNKNRMQVIFDIEGINQKMHEHYRRKVNFEKLLH